MTCVHRWKIPSPDGRAMLPATCKHCGATKAFPASLEFAYGEKVPLTLKGSAKHARLVVTRKAPATHCTKGHELTEGNVVFEVTGRTRCKTCRQMYSRNSKRRAVIRQYEARG